MKNIFQEGKTKALLQWRFNSVEEINAEAETIKAYVEEAILNQKQGKEIKPAKNKLLEIPEELQQHFRVDSELKASFDR